MSKKIAPLLLAFFSALATHNIHADDIQRVRLFFGLSTPDGVVAARDWKQFLEREIATTFAGLMWLTRWDIIAANRNAPKWSP